MKAILLLFFCVVVVFPHFGNAQVFSPTAGQPCYNCHPTNYSVSKSPSISDVWNPYGNLDDRWNIPNFLLPIPPSTHSQSLPSGQGKNSFVTLKTSEGAFDDQLYIDVSGFIVGKSYKLHYAVLSASVQYEAGNISPFGESATMYISTIGQNPDLFIKSQTTTFTSANRNQWIAKEITFTPLASTLRFKLSGATSGQSAGYVNFSIDKYPFDCLLLPDQITLNTASPIYTLFPTDKLDLNTVSVIGGPPVSSELVWKSGANSTDPTLTSEEVSNAPISNQNPLNLKPYYAFYYAKDFNCYNVPISQAEIKFMYTPAQVSLKLQTNVFLSCPAITADLTAIEENPVAQVRWFNNNTHSGLPVFDPKAVPPGDYYAFYYEWQTGTYSLKPGQISNAHVHVENAVPAGIPDLGPLMTINSLFFASNASKDFVVKIENSKAENSNCSVYFKVSKLPGFTITYSTQAGQANGIFTNNDFWTFSEDNNYITVTSKNGIAANGYSYIGFQITRNANTPADSKQSLSITIPQPGGGGDTNVSNNQTITGLSTN